MREARVYPGASYSQPAHIETPWWHGFNDAKDGREYGNPYTSRTDVHEYDLGYRIGTKGK